MLHVPSLLNVVITPFLFCELYLMLRGKALIYYPPKFHKFNHHIADLL